MKKLSREEILERRKANILLGIGKDYFRVFLFKLPTADEAAVTATTLNYYLNDFGDLTFGKLDDTIISSVNELVYSWIPYGFRHQTIKIFPYNGINNKYLCIEAESEYEDIINDTSWKENIISCSDTTSINNMENLHVIVIFPMSRSIPLIRIYDHEITEDKYIMFDDNECIYNSFHSKINIKTRTIEERIMSNVNQMKLEDYHIAQENESITYNEKGEVIAYSNTKNGISMEMVDLDDESYEEIIYFADDIIYKGKGNKNELFSSKISHNIDRNDYITKSKYFSIDINSPFTETLNLINKNANIVSIMENRLNSEIRYSDSAGIRYAKYFDNDGKLKDYVGDNVRISFGFDNDKYHIKNFDSDIFKLSDGIYIRDAYGIPRLFKV